MTLCDKWRTEKIVEGGVEVINMGIKMTKGENKKGSMLMQGGHGVKDCGKV